MDELTRRSALRQTAGAGLFVALTPAATAGAEPAADDTKARDKATELPEGERDRVMAVGMTEAEAECWEFAAKTAGKFFSLPELHPMDKQEIATAIHVIQNKLLSRPTYRRYVELAKAAARPK